MALTMIGAQFTVVMPAAWVVLVASIFGGIVLGVVLIAYRGSRPFRDRRD